MWKEGTTLSAKIASSLLLLSLIGMILPLIFPNFIPSAGVNWLAMAISLILTIATLWMYIRLRTKKKIEPVTKGWSILKRLLVVPLFPFLIFGYFWLNLALALPKSINYLVGSNNTIVGHVRKKEIRSSKQCNYQIELGSTKKLFFLFRYCISEEEFYDFPTGKVEATIFVKKSFLGMTVSKIIENKK